FLPNELGDVEHDLRRAGIAARAHLTRERANGVVEPAVPLVTTHVRRRADDLAVARRVGATVAAQVEEDRRAVVGLDRTLEIRQVGLVRSPSRVVRAAKVSVEPPLTPAFGDEEVRALQPVRPLELGMPVLGITERHAIQRLEPHARATSRSTYFASTSTSMFTTSPGPRAPSVVTASVCGTSATAKPWS